MSHALILFMSCLGWFHNSNPKEEVLNAGGLVAAVIHDIMDFFPREEGNGWDIPKIHGFLQMVFYIQFYGNALNFFTGPGEHAHIRLLKDNARRTQKQPSTFGKQIADRLQENLLLRRAEDNLIHQLYDDVTEMPGSCRLKQKQKEWELNKMTDLMALCLSQAQSPCKFVSSEGRYEVSLSVNSTPSSGQPLIKSDVWWASGNAKKRKKNIGICYELQMYLAKMAERNENRCIKGVGYTSIHVQFPDIEKSTIIRCSDDYNGKPWYDYVAFKIGHHVVPGKVCGIIKIGDEYKIVIHSANIPANGSTPFSFVDRLKEDFLAKFSLGPIESCLIAITVDQLVMPLITFSNYGENMKTDKVCLLPKRMWASFFGRYLRNSHFWPSD